MLEINLSEEEKAWLNEAKKLIDSKKWKEALAHIEKIQKQMQGPHASMIFIYRGIAQKELGDKKSAGQSFMTALSIVNYAPKSDEYAQLIKREAAHLLGKKLPD